MAVSSIKGCWSKLSARIRDYIDVVDSYYRPAGELENAQVHGGDHLNHVVAGHRAGHKCGKRDCLMDSLVQLAASHHSNPRHNSSTKSSQRHHRHHHHQNCPVNYHDKHSARITAQVHHQQRNEANNSVVPPASRKQNCLSMGFTKRKTAQGQVYFVDSNGHKCWHDPSVPRELLHASLDLDSLVGALSDNWEVGETSCGRKYFINHDKQTTQFTDPRLVQYRDHLMKHLRRSGAPNPNSSVGRLRKHTESVPNQNKELFDKISILRQELLKQQVQSHPLRIDIHRKRIFEESFRAVSQMLPRDLKKRLLVKFRGEEGLDYGGVAREWFYLLSREILNPNHGLFQYTSNDIYNLQINPDSGLVYREHLSYLNFCGRIIGMAVFHGHFIEGHFTLPFYKMLLKKPITLEDIEFVDPELHRSLCWILENDITDVIDTTFSVQHNAFGQLQEHELKEGGRNIVVTEENKLEYVSLYVNYRCRRGIESQFEALQRGFYELISPSLVENFDERELELLIGGLSKINTEDWRLHTKLKNCTIETPLVIWFWDIVESYDEDRRARLLQFVTGSPRVPIQGFKALQGVNSELRLFTIHLIRNACTDDLPKSHTCFNRIDLPPYETYDKLRDKLTQAIEETIGFAMQ